MRKSYKIHGLRSCFYCKKDFQPTVSQQQFCGEDYANCGFCGEQFKINPSRWKRGKSEYCSNSCGSLSQMKSKLDPAHIGIYRDPKSWCEGFKKKHGYKPCVTDFLVEFGVNPSIHSRIYFSRRPASGFERVVQREIAKHYEGEILSRRKPLMTAEGRRLEVDIWIPELSIGFEVQDFKTHSLNSERPRMNGPQAHSLKRKLVKRQLSGKLYEIWENELMDGSFRERIKRLVNRAKFEAVEREVKTLKSLESIVVDPYSFPENSHRVHHGNKHSSLCSICISTYDLEPIDLQKLVETVDLLGVTHAARVLNENASRVTAVYDLIAGETNK